MELLKELNGEGLTMVMATYDPENREYFDRTLVLRDGVIVS